jgi:hypothetical protein
LFVFKLRFGDSDHDQTLRVQGIQN